MWSWSEVFDIDQSSFDLVGLLLMLYCWQLQCKNQFVSARNLRSMQMVFRLPPRICSCIVGRKITAIVSLRGGSIKHQEFVIYRRLILLQTVMEIIFVIVRFGYKSHECEIMINQSEKRYECLLLNLLW